LNTAPRKRDKKVPGAQALRISADPRMRVAIRNGVLRASVV
jgi:hypothetical protein